MKFLITTTPHGNLPPEAAERLFEAGRQWINARVEDGTIESVYAFPEGGAVTIGNADSHEELMRQIRGMPLFPFVAWDIRPVVDINESFSSAIEMFRSMAGQSG